MKAKVTKVTKYDKTDSYGNISFAIELANGDKGFFSTKDANQTKFVVGQESEYNIEQKTSKTGSIYHKITLPGEQNQYKGGGKPGVEPRIQMIGFAMSYTKDLIVAGKIQMKELADTFEIIYNEMIGKI